MDEQLEKRKKRRQNEEVDNYGKWAATGMMRKQTDEERLTHAAE